MDILKVFTVLNNLPEGQNLFQAKTQFGSCQTRVWQLQNLSLATAKPQFGSCLPNFGLAAAKPESKRGVGSCQTRQQKLGPDPDPGPTWAQIEASNSHILTTITPDQGLELRCQAKGLLCLVWADRPMSI